MTELPDDEYEPTEPNHDPFPPYLQRQPPPPLGRTLQPKRLEMATRMLRSCLDRLRATL